MKRTRRILVAIALLAIVVLVSVVGSIIWRQSEINLERQRGIDLLQRVNDKSPPEVNKDVWRVAWVWTHNAYGESFLPFKSDPVVMKRLNDELEERLQQNVSFATWDWVWEQLKGSTAAGAHYYERFFPQYKDHVERASK